MNSARNAVVVLVAFTITANTEVSSQQVADTAFDVSVGRPAYARNGPVVMIDEAHRNFHTATGRYLPFANLLRSDGFTIVRGSQAFTKNALRSVDVLVISNATGPEAGEKSVAPAFSESECNYVRDWVRAGGALLLVADHAPYGAAAANLARRFGIEFGNGFVFDSTASLEGASTILVFTSASRSLGDHPILRGRDSTERISRVITFTGQSMTVPPAAVALLRLSDAAREGATREDVSSSRGNPMTGRAQGIAFPFGRGRVVVLGEAAMLSAQIARWEQDGKTVEFLMGMNHPGSDDKKFALNVMRWLTGVLN